MKILFLAFTFLTFSAYSQTNIEADSTQIVKSEKPEIKIRSIRIFQNNDGHLFILDGVPILSDEGALKNLDPDNIVSIKVLKDIHFGCLGNGLTGAVIISTKDGISQDQIVEKDYPFKVYKVNP